MVEEIPSDGWIYWMFSGAQDSSFVLFPKISIHRRNNHPDRDNANNSETNIESSADTNPVQRIRIEKGCNGHIIGLR